MEKQLVKRIELLRKWLEDNNQILSGWFHRNGEPKDEYADVWKKINTAHEESRFLFGEVLASAGDGRRKGYVLDIYTTDRDLLFSTRRVYDRYEDAREMLGKFQLIYHQSRSPVRVDIREVDLPEENEK